MTQHKHRAKWDYLIFISYFFHWRMWACVRLYSAIGLMTAGQTGIHSGWIFGGVIEVTMGRHPDAFISHQRWVINSMKKKKAWGKVNITAIPSNSHLICPFYYHYYWFLKSYDLCWTNKSECLAFRRDQIWKLLGNLAPETGHNWDDRPRNGGKYISCLFFVLYWLLSLLSCRFLNAADLGK